VNHPNELMPGDEEDGMIVNPTQEVNLKCPITKTMMVNPVTKYASRCILSLVFSCCSKPCGHHYSKDAIMEMLKKMPARNQSVPCPVAGMLRFRIVRSFGC
jgi:hypothetical protein